MKTYQSWLLGALACATIVPFTGCTKDEMVGPNGGNGETYETELTIALKTGNGTKTRATSEETQSGESKFNGMTDIRLVSYSVTGITEDNYKPGVDADNTIIKVTSLTDLDAIGTVSDKYFKQRDLISLPQQTQAFLFYGKSKYAGVGDITTNISTTGAVNTINFDLVSKTEPGEGVYETPMEAYLAGVYKALYDFNPAYLTGSGTSASTSGAIDATTFYNNLKLAKSGAFNQIAHLMAQIYVLANNNGFAASDPAGTGSLDAVKKAIYDTGNTVVFESEPSGTYSDGKISSLNYTTVSDGLATALDASKMPTVYKLQFYDFTDVGTNSTGILTFDDTNTYAYPAALYYYVNTYPVDYTTLEFNNLTWGNGVLTNKKDVADLGDKVPSKIAMAHTAQYAVGRLDVKLEDGTVGTSGNIPDGEGTNIAFNKLTLKAILIGNQKQVGWNFLPTGSGDKVIYDNEFGGNDGKTNACQVLALPSVAGESVNIALEMTNGDTPFVGKGGQIIPKNSTFYLTAQLNPNTATQGVTGITNPAVFMSDYYTTATLKLKSLVNAENTVPDLSGSSLEFALSVDLGWNQGLVFDVPIQ